MSHPHHRHTPPGKTVTQKANLGFSDRETAFSCGPPAERSEHQQDRVTRGLPTVFVVVAVVLVSFVFKMW